MTSSRKKPSNYVCPSWEVSDDEAPTPYLLIFPEDLAIRWEHAGDSFDRLRRIAREREMARWDGFRWIAQSAKSYQRLLASAQEEIPRAFHSQQEALESFAKAKRKNAAESPAIEIFRGDAGTAGFVQREVSGMPVADSVFTHAVVFGNERRYVALARDEAEVSGIVDEIQRLGFRAVEAQTAGQIVVSATFDGWLASIALNVVQFPILAALLPDWSDTPMAGEIAELLIPVYKWNETKSTLCTLGAEVREEAAFEPAPFATMPNGWNDPAPNGYRLFPYQRHGVEFARARNYRCLIADEMGVGKTAQAIAAAQASGAKRILVIAPANARHVWDRNVAGWTGAETAIQHLRASRDKICIGDGWTIAGYDQITVRAESWTPENKTERTAVSKWLRANGLPRTKVGKRIEIPDAAANVMSTPELDEKRLHRWKTMMHRLRGGVLREIEAWRPDMLIVDEAHRAKNSNAKRTQSLVKLSGDTKFVLLLTGTPVRNHERDIVSLLRLVDGRAYGHLVDQYRKHSSWEDIVGMLEYLQIRRLKKDVLPQLPPFVRSPIFLDIDVPRDYIQTMDGALDKYDAAIRGGESVATDRQLVVAEFSMARRILGSAKAAPAIEFILETLEENERGCVVVFCAHHNTTDKLRIALTKAGKRVGVIDGRTPSGDRPGIVSNFQDGKLDVFVGGILAASEAIDLYRADTVIFVEQDWVPGNIQQAEARIHRNGQTADTVWTYHLLVDPSCLNASANIDAMLWEALESKLATINAILNEEETLLGDENSASAKSVMREVLDKFLGSNRIKAEEEIKATRQKPTTGPSYRVEDIRRTQQTGIPPGR